MAQTQTKTKRKILNIPLPAKLFWEVEKVAQEESKTKAEFARDVLRQYLKKEKEWAEIFKLGERTAKKFGIKTEDDVERIVDEVRCSK